MTTKTHTWKDSILTLLKEIYEGPPEPSGTWVVDNATDAGIFGTIANLSAEDASKPPASGRNSVAAHVNHLRYSLEVANTYARGEKPANHWEQSWELQKVNEDQWRELKANLRIEFEQALESLKGLATEDELLITGFMALPAHGAYHLGAIRQQVISK